MEVLGQLQDNVLLSRVLVSQYEADMTIFFLTLQQIHRHGSELRGSITH